MSKRRRRVLEASPVWDCPDCQAQWRSGVRCPLHNPTPEQRAAHPERYVRGVYANGKDEVRR